MPPCELYVVRHAIAAERGPDWPDDDKRPLTEKGMARFKDGLLGLTWLDVVLDEIFSSPLVRAKQTADLLAAGISGKPPVNLLTALAPGHSPEEVMTHLARVAKRPLAFRKGGVCRLDLQGFTGKRPASLTWFLTPKMLRQLGKRD